MFSTLRFYVGGSLLIIFLMAVGAARIHQLADAKVTEDVSSQMIATIWILFGIIAIVAGVMIWRAITGLKPKEDEPESDDADSPLSGQQAREYQDIRSNKNVM